GLNPDHEPPRRQGGQEDREKVAQNTEGRSAGRERELASPAFLPSFLFLCLLGVLGALAVRPPRRASALILGKRSQYNRRAAPPAAFPGQGGPPCVYGFSRLSRWSQPAPSPCR